MRKIDCHVHIVGDGSSGSGCWFRLPGLWKKFLGRMMIKGVGLPVSSLKRDMDKLYSENLARQVRESSLDAAVILAQDIPRSDDGEPMESEAQFYVPNEYVAELAKRHEEFIPACSIHPNRPDAMDELEKCIELKMPVLKLLPNCLNIDYSDKKFVPFWNRMAEAGMILLSHTGGEMTVKVFNPEDANPAKLVTPLDCGVTVIAAHCAGRSGLFDPNWTPDLLEMFKKHPNLYGDNSAVATPNRARTIKPILPSEVQQRIIHGSDYPVPVGGLGPWLMGHLSFGDCWKTRKVKNIIERDYLLKRYSGFDTATFTRMDELIQKSGMMSRDDA